MVSVINETLSANGNAGGAGGLTWPGGHGTLILANDDGGGTTVLQIIDDEGNIQTMNDVNGSAMSYTAPTVANFFLAKGAANIRVNLSGSTTPDWDIQVLDERAGL